MKIKFEKFGLVLAIFTWAASASAAPVVLTFEDLAGRALFQAMPATYGGVQWSANFWAYDKPQTPYTPKSGIVRIASNGDSPGNSEFSFVGGNAQFDGAWFSGGGTSVSMQLFDNSILVHTSISLTPSDVPIFLSSGYSGQVDMVRIIGTTGLYTFDDLQFTPVPEPTTVSLALASGLGWLALARRGRKSRIHELD